MIEKILLSTIVLLAIAVSITTHLLDEKKQTHRYDDLIVVEEYSTGRASVWPGEWVSLKAITKGDVR